MRLVFVDDDQRYQTINGHKVITFSQFTEVEASEHNIVIAIANGNIRKIKAERCIKDGIRPLSITASNVVIMDDVQIGEGAILSPFVTLTSNIRIGQHFQANIYSYVEHDCMIGDFVTFAPGAKCNGNIVIEGEYKEGEIVVLDFLTGPNGQTLEIYEEEIKIYTNKQGVQVPKEEYDKMLSFVRGEIKVFKVEYQSYRNGNEKVNHGYYKEYREDGQISSEGNYVDGKKDGKWVWYHENGQIRSEYNYKDGKEDGEWVSYWENGQISYEGNYKDGEKDGKWVFYDEEGNITDEDIYENDVCVEKCEGNE